METLMMSKEAAHRIVATDQYCSRGGEGVRFLSYVHVMCLFVLC